MGKLTGNPTATYIFLICELPEHLKGLGWSCRSIAAGSLGLRARAGDLIVFVRV